MSFSSTGIILLLPHQHSLDLIHLNHKMHGVLINLFGPTNFIGVKSFSEDKLKLSLFTGN